MIQDLATVMGVSPAVAAVLWVGVSFAILSAGFLASNKLAAITGDWLYGVDEAAREEARPAARKSDFVSAQPIQDQPAAKSEPIRPEVSDRDLIRYGQASDMPGVQPVKFFSARDLYPFDELSLQVNADVEQPTVIEADKMVRVTVKSSPKFWSRRHRFAIDKWSKIHRAEETVSQDTLDSLAKAGYFIVGKAGIGTPSSLKKRKTEPVKSRKRS